MSERRHFLLSLLAAAVIAAVIVVPSASADTDDKATSETEKAQPVRNGEKKSLDVIANDPKHISAVKADGSSRQVD